MNYQNGAFLYIASTQLIHLMKQDKFNKKQAILGIVWTWTSIIALYTFLYLFWTEEAIRVQKFFLISGLVLPSYSIYNSYKTENTLTVGFKKFALFSLSTWVLLIFTLLLIRDSLNNTIVQAVLFPLFIGIPLIYMIINRKSIQA